ncbi:hypothetical protein JTB14_026527 [Gonioctena quinquepunctata]|nr:hypothetical protein JTB14_026527 [Gonioctena quinquepunctata]
MKSLRYDSHLQNFKRMMVQELLDMLKLLGELLEEKGAVNIENALYRKNSDKAMAKRDEINSSPKKSKNEKTESNKKSFTHD